MNPQARRRGGIFGSTTFRAAYLVLLVGFALGATFAFALHRQQARIERQVFDRKASDLTALLSARLKQYAVFLQGVQGLFQASTRVTPGEMSAFIGIAGRGFPADAFHDIGVVRRVESASVPRHVEFMRANFRSDYALQTGPEGILEGVAYPITHVAGFRGKLVEPVTAIGWDMGQDPVRRGLLETARDRDAIAASGLLALHGIDTTNKQDGLLVALPLHDLEPSPGGGPGRHRRFSGAVFASVIPRELFMPLVGGLDGVQVRVRLPESPEDFAVFDSSGEDGARATSFGDVDGLGRSWTLEFREDSHFQADHRSLAPLWVALATWGFTAILAGMAALQAQRRVEAEDAAGRLRVSEGAAVAARVGLEERERQLLAERDRLDVTLRSIGDAVVTTDTEARVVSVNPVAEALLGVTTAEAVGRDAGSLVQMRERLTGTPLADLDGRLRSISATELIPGFYTIRTPEGAERTVVVTMAPLSGKPPVAGRVLVLRDLTERRQLEEEQIRTAKLESVGLLAGGIAHDFNNYLTAVLGNLSLARGVQGDEREHLLERAEHSVKRAQRLTRQLLTFAKGGAPVVRPTDLGELVQETVEFATRGSNVDSEFDLPADLWSCAIDPEQISRVIQNLAVNAAQAMPDGGTLHVSARNVDAVPRLGPGRFVRVSVRDQGPGIAPENVPRIFEPYFSTKAGGTGLGLATAFRIVRQHQGDITVASTPGMGACFEVWLPAAAEAPAADPPTPRASGKGGARVLVLDDDQSIRDVSCAMLRRLGYEPEAVREGCEAVRIANEARMAGRPFDVAILDLTVPDGMGGLETLARLKEEHPGVRAIVSSGYSSDPVMADYSAHGFAGVLEKPYRLDEMAVVIERVLRK